MNGIFLLLASAATGLVAAFYWYQSSVVKTAPSWVTEPVDSTLSQMGWISGMLEAGDRAAKLNKTAALWTAVSVALSAVSGFVSSFAQ